MSFVEDLRDASDNAPLVNQYARALTRVGTKRGAKVAEVAGALIGNLAAVVKASAEPEHWPEAARVLTEELRRQLLNGH